MNKQGQFKVNQVFLDDEVRSKPNKMNGKSSSRLKLKANLKGIGDGAGPKGPPAIRPQQTQSKKAQVPRVKNDNNKLMISLESDMVAEHDEFPEAGGQDNLGAKPYGSKAAALSKEAYNDISQLVDDIGLRESVTLELTTLQHEQQDYLSFQNLELIDYPYIEAFNGKMIGDRFFEYRMEIRVANNYPYRDLEAAASVGAADDGEAAPELKAFGMPSRPDHMVTIDACNEDQKIYEDTMSEQYRKYHELLKTHTESHARPRLISQQEAKMTKQRPEDQHDTAQTLSNDIGHIYMKHNTFTHSNSIGSGHSMKQSYHNDSVIESIEENPYQDQDEMDPYTINDRIEESDEEAEYSAIAGSQIIVGGRTDDLNGKRQSRSSRSQGASDEEGDVRVQESFGQPYAQEWKHENEQDFVMQEDDGVVDQQTLSLTPSRDADTQRDGSVEEAQRQEQDGYTGSVPTQEEDYYGIDSQHEEIGECIPGGASAILAVDEEEAPVLQWKAGKSSRSRSRSPASQLSKVSSIQVQVNWKANDATSTPTTTIKARADTQVNDTSHLSMGNTEKLLPAPSKKPQVRSQIDLLHNKVQMNKIHLQSISSVERATDWQYNKIDINSIASNNMKEGIRNSRTILQTTTNNSNHIQDASARHRDSETEMQLNANSFLNGEDFKNEAVVTEVMNPQTIPTSSINKTSRREAYEKFKDYINQKQQKKNKKQNFFLKNKVACELNSKDFVSPATSRLKNSTKRGKKAPGQQLVKQKSVALKTVMNSQEMNQQSGFESIKSFNNITSNQIGEIIQYVSASASKDNHVVYEGPKKKQNTTVMQPRKAGFIYRMQMSKEPSRAKFSPDGTMIRDKEKNFTYRSKNQKVTSKPKTKRESSSREGFSSKERFKANNRDKDANVRTEPNDKKKFIVKTYNKIRKVKSQVKKETGHFRHNSKGSKHSKNSKSKSPKFINPRFIKNLDMNLFRKSKQNKRLCEYIKDTNQHIECGQDGDDFNQQMDSVQLVKPMQPFAEGNMSLNLKNASNLKHSRNSSIFRENAKTMLQKSNESKHVSMNISNDNLGMWQNHNSSSQKTILKYQFVNKAAPPLNHNQSQANTEDLTFSHNPIDEFGFEQHVSQQLTEANHNDPFYLQFKDSYLQSQQKQLCMNIMLNRNRHNFSAQDFRRRMMAQKNHSDALSLRKGVEKAAEANDPSRLFNQCWKESNYQPVLQQHKQNSRQSPVNGIFSQHKSQKLINNRSNLRVSAERFTTEPSFANDYQEPSQKRDVFQPSNKTTCQHKDMLGSQMETSERTLETQAPQAEAAEHMDPEMRKNLCFSPGDQSKKTQGSDRDKKGKYKQTMTPGLGIEDNNRSMHQNASYPLVFHGLSPKTDALGSEAFYRKIQKKLNTQVKSPLQRGNNLTVLSKKQVPPAIPQGPHQRYQKPPILCKSALRGSTKGQRLLNETDADLYQRYNTNLKDQAFNGQRKGECSSNQRSSRKPDQMTNLVRHGKQALISSGGCILQSQKYNIRNPSQNSCKNILRSKNLKHQLENNRYQHQLSSENIGGHIKQKNNSLLSKAMYQHGNHLKQASNQPKTVRNNNYPNNFNLDQHDPRIHSQIAPEDQSRILNNFVSSYAQDPKNPGAPPSGRGVESLDISTGDGSINALIRNGVNYDQSRTGSRQVQNQSSNFVLYPGRDKEQSRKRDQIASPFNQRPPSTHTNKLTQAYQGTLPQQMLMKRKSGELRSRKSSTNGFKDGTTNVVIQALNESDQRLVYTYEMRKAQKLIEEQAEAIDSTYNHMIKKKLSVSEELGMSGAANGDGRMESFEDYQQSKANMNGIIASSQAQQEYQSYGNPDLTAYSPRQGRDLKLPIKINGTHIKSQQVNDLAVKDSQYYSKRTDYSKKDMKLDSSKHVKEMSFGIAMRQSSSGLQNDSQNILTFANSKSSKGISIKLSTDQSSSTNQKYLQNPRTSFGSQQNTKANTMNNKKAQQNGSKLHITDLLNLEDNQPSKNTATIIDQSRKRGTN